MEIVLSVQVTCWLIETATGERYRRWIPGQWEEWVGTHDTGQDIWDAINPDFRPALIADLEDCFREYHAPWNTLNTQ